MSTEYNKQFLNVKDPTSVLEEKVQRPNIDVLIKKIMQQRRHERKKNIAVIFLILIGFVITSFVFLQ